MGLKNTIPIKRKRKQVVLFDHDGVVACITLGMLYIHVCIFMYIYSFILSSLSLLYQTNVLRFPKSSLYHELLITVKEDRCRFNGTSNETLAGGKKERKSESKYRSVLIPLQFVFIARLDFD